MKLENRALLLLVVTVVVVTGVGGAFVYLAPESLPTTLPIPTGTTFSTNDTWYWAAYFNVSEPGFRIVGAWTAYDAFGYPNLVVANGSVPPPGPGLFRCPPLITPNQPVYHGTIDRTVGVGAHTVYWSNVCTIASKVVVTETVRLTQFPLP